MLAKIIVRADTRDAALAKLRDALAHTEVHGIETNLDYLRAIAGSEATGEAGTKGSTSRSNLSMPIWIEADSPLHAVLAARAQALNPFCTLAHMPGAGHHVRFEAYEPYMRSVHAFLHGLS